MIRFTGEFKAKLDDKGRLVFPAAFKALMGEEADMRFVVKKSLFAECLEMYTYAEWVSDSDAVRARLNLFNREHDRFWREYMRGTATIEPDGKLGRISIPKDLLAKAGIEREVVFCGNNHKIEIWEKSKYDAQSLSSEDFTALAEKILG